MINGFQEWAASNGVLLRYSLAELSGRAVAIQAEDYIDKILTGSATREPLLPALGGIPFLLESTIDSQIKIFRELNIKVMFVFNGLDPNSQKKNLASSLDHSKNVGEAWDLYNASDPEQAVVKFGNSCMDIVTCMESLLLMLTGNFSVDNIYRHVQGYFHHTGVNFIVGPYSALAQVSMSSMSSMSWSP